jgi:hypothetical protein
MGIYDSPKNQFLWFFDDVKPKNQPFSDFIEFITEEKKYTSASKKPFILLINL